VEGRTRVDACGETWQATDEDSSGACSSGEADLALPIGTSVDRYLVLERLGAGGAGVVFKAYDPELDRLVALKLVRTERRAGEALRQARLRLLREAQALAQLAHPNVVSVHDVGTYREDVFLAMEYVAGVNLSQQRARGKASWRQTLRYFIAAGRGLAAAHEAGLIHRDFKPDNVLVGDDGRVRVADFGLARTTTESDVDATSAPGSHALASPGVACKRWSLTRTGSLVGTPLYMAPEQFAFEDADERSDQFSFCVALYEALYGRRPFSGRSFQVLSRSVLSGALEPPTRRSRVPRYVWRALSRGLRRNRDDRWESMSALLAALQPHRRRRVRFALAVVAALVAGFAIASHARKASENELVCKGAEGELRGVWDESVRAELEQAFLGTGKPYAADALRRVERQLDEHAKAWAAAQTRTCEATHVYRQQSERVLDLRMTCLERRRSEMGALLHQLTAMPEPGVLEHAVQAVGDLISIDSCSEQAVADSTFPLPVDPVRRAAIVDLRGRVHEVDALRKTGQLERAAVAAEAIAEELRTIDYPPLSAEGLYVVAESRFYARRDPEQVDRALVEALHAAAAVGDDVLLARAWSYEIAVRGYMLGQPANGLALLETAELAALRGRDDIALGWTYNNTGLLHYLAGHYDAAQADFERSLAAKERARGRDHWDVGLTLHNLGMLARDQGDDKRAAALFERALEVLEKSLGRDHPQIANVLVELGRERLKLGDRSAAIELLERALAVAEQGLGNDHPWVADALAGLGEAFLDAGDAETARAHALRALAIREKVWGPEHADLAGVLELVGDTWLASHVWKDAHDVFARALEIRAAARGQDHASLSHAIRGLATALSGMNRGREADGYRAQLLALAAR